MKAFLAGASALAVAVFNVAHAAPVDVDVELQLLVDVSGSISSSEFNLQRQGYEDAFRSTQVINAITGGDIGSVAVQMIYWSSDTLQQIAVDWTEVTDATSSNALADAIAAASRPFGGSTGIEAAMDFGRPLFFSNDFNGTRLVQDVSGDGQDNEGGNPAAARDAADAAGITVNALPIGGSSITNYYANNVATLDGFVLGASGFDEFADAVRRKIFVEITDTEIPVPAPLLLMGSALAGFVGTKKRKAAK